METTRGSRRDTAEVYCNLRAAAWSGWDFSSRWLIDWRTLSTNRTSSCYRSSTGSQLSQW